MMKPDFKKENCEVWIIGAPEDETDPDCGHITSQCKHGHHNKNQNPYQLVNLTNVSLVLKKTTVVKRTLW